MFDVADRGSFYDAVGAVRDVVQNYLLQVLAPLAMDPPVFFFGSAGASAGYLTVSEFFPIEVRAQAIAVFFAVAQHQ